MTSERKERRLTGAYLFAVRDGERRPVDISDMTEEEIRSKMGGLLPVDLIGWIVMLCQSIREMGDEFDIVRGGK